MPADLLIYATAEVTPAQRATLAEAATALSGDWRLIVRGESGFGGRQFFSVRLFGGEFTTVRMFGPEDAPEQIAQFIDDAKRDSESMR